MRIINPHKKKSNFIRLKLIPGLLTALVLVFGVILVSSRKPILLEDYIEENAEVQPIEEIKIKTIHSGEISKNSNLYAELLNLEMEQTLVADITSRFSRIFNLKKSQPGDNFKVFLDPDNNIVAFEYVSGDLKRYRLDRDGDDFIESVGDVGLDRFVKEAKGEVHTTLWDALQPMLPDMSLFFDMVEIFGWEIDFLTEPRVGDTFHMIFEIYEKDGGFIKIGRILAVEYVLEGNSHKAFLFTDPTGYQDYYDENGYSLRKALLKSPLNYRRISSTFSWRRLHPVYKIYRPHLGVDYAAPIGTPIVAAGDGYVTFKGDKKGFGNYLEIRHSFDLITCYGHLRSFARGVKKGRHVVQGQVIGYVGNTGESTGPHLDYRVRRKGKYINPLKMTIPAALPVNDEYRPQFNHLVAQYMPYFNNQSKERLFARLD
ncbi:MAG: M23 family metallopeptidase [Candidatus Zixiibacteriota bacterium]|nr:MAG: M23 family metallopeptidase [candidate division Zixibacteria bacterium]